MSNLFEIALINPIRFVQVLTPNARYQTLPFDLNRPNPCYFQKFQTGDTTKIQVLSDFNTVLLKIYDLHSNALLQTINPVIPTLAIKNQTFKAYEFEIVFASLGQVECYAEITYTDASSIVQVYQSEPIEVLADQSNTLLLTYKNSENNYSVLFDTGIEFNLRVEGTIQDFKPEFTDVIYNDQLQNATKLNSVPYRSFNLYIGNAPGIPDWIADKVNRAFSCDEFQVDGTYYEKVSGEKWNTHREVEYQYVGMQIPVTPVDNLFLERLKTGDTPPGDFLPVQKELNYFNQASDLPIANVFKKYSLLEKIVIYRYGAAFTLNVGTTNGGSDIYTHPITDLITTITINYAFSGAQDIFLSGLNGGNSDVCVIYKQLDTLPITIGSPNPYATLGKGAVVIYETPAGQALSADFNLGTGLGNVNTAWFGWAICDGRNGTVDRGLTVPVGYKAGATKSDVNASPGTDVLALGNPFGEGQHKLLLSEMPKINVKQVRTDTVGAQYEGNHMKAGGDRGLWTGNDQFFGGDLPHNNIQPSIYSLYVKKISDGN